MLAVRGLGLVGLNDSLLRLYLCRAEEATLRTMLLHPDSAAAERRATEIGETFAGMAAGIRLATERIVALSRDGLDVEVYWYRQVPTWRMVALDDAMFVSVFDSSAEGHTSALYQLVPALGGVLYRGYRRMFEVLRTGSTCCRLTYKEAAVGGTDSKPEHETSIGDPAVLPTLFAALGLDVIIELTKRCTNYSFDYAGYRMLATVVTVPELEGTWLEVETQVAGAGDVPAALDAIRALLGELGIAPDDLDSRTYTGLVADARRSRDSGHDRKFVQGLPGSDGA